MRFTQYCLSLPLLFILGCTTGAPSQMGNAPGPSPSQGSSASKACGALEISCGDGTTCITKDQLCDETIDCPNEADKNANQCKDGPIEPSGCADGEFACKDAANTCIPGDKKCDGTSECPGEVGADEMNCAATPPTPPAGQQTCEQQGQVSCTNDGGATIVCRPILCRDGLTCAQNVNECPNIGNGCPANAQLVCPLNTTYAGQCTSSIANCNRAAECLAGQTLCNDDKCYSFVCNNTCQNTPCTAQQPDPVGPNSCAWANDGVCDDGRDGSAYDVCGAGTDEADCAGVVAGPASNCAAGQTDCFGDGSHCLRETGDQSCGSAFCRSLGEYTCNDGVTCVGQLANCNNGPDSCPLWANDNECDDGRPGSTSSACQSGTDETDCLAIVGDDSCPLWANDGSCDDGRPGAPYSVCSAGTDATDCAAL